MPVEGPEPGGPWMGGHRGQPLSAEEEEARLEEFRKRVGKQQARLRAEQEVRIQSAGLGIVALGKRIKEEERNTLVARVISFGGRLAKGAKTCYVWQVTPLGL